MRIMGIDPGLSGALAVIDTETGEVFVDDMPVIEVLRKRVRSKRTKKMRDKVRRAVCGKRVADWVEEFKPDVAIVEKVGSRPGEGVVSVFTFGESYGKVCGAVEAMNVQLLSVTPAVWKRHTGLLGTDKKASIRAACRMFPKVRDRLSRVKDNGRAEALLIAAYGHKVHFPRGVDKRTH